MRRPRQRRHAAEHRKLRFSDGVIVNVANGAGATTVAVPNVVGLSIGTDGGRSRHYWCPALTATAEREQPDGASSGTVDQPEPGGWHRTVRSGSAVNVVIAVGALVPNVAGARGSRRRPHGRGTHGRFSTRRQQRDAAGIVLSAGSAGGNDQAPGTGVALTVPLGPPTC